MKGLLRALACLAAALALGPATSWAANPAKPADVTNEPLQDGCQRNPGALLATGAGAPSSSPEWVFVHRDPTLRMLDGVANGTHTAGEDLPHSHDWYDMDTNVLPDPQYDYLLAGDPGKKDGNYALGADGKPGEDTNRLHTEWESGTLPSQAWPTENDRVRMWGQWIWDCGHWGEGVEDPDYFLPGSGPFTKEPLRGEQTEFHPLRAIVVQRAHPFRTSRRESQADVFISSDGNRARAEETCAQQHPAMATFGYGPDYVACVAAELGRRQPVNDIDYSFHVPAPPRPPGAPKLYYRVVDFAHGNGPREQVDVRPDGIDVVVPFKGFGNDAQKLAYGKTFYVGWRASDPDPPSLVHVSFGKFTVFHSLDPENPDHPEQFAPPPGEYSYYAEVDGAWQYLNDWAKGLAAVSDGQSFDLGHSMSVYRRDHDPVRVFVFGRECDLPQILPCPDVKEGSDGNDHPGDVTDVFKDPGSSVGAHTMNPTTGDWQLAYTVTCDDRGQPVSRASARSLRLTRSGVSLRGTASDRGCGSRPSGVKRVYVAVGLRSGRRCRFLRPDGRLGSRITCRRRARYIAARGVARWSFHRGARLPAGRYVIYVRALDRAGNVERYGTAANTLFAGIS